jgi:DNA-binding NarL/FixJ family response regulator
MTAPVAHRDRTGAGQAHKPGRLPGDVRLTEQRTRILVLMANGFTNREIAAHHFLSEEAIKSHVRVIYADLGARDRCHAVAIALVRGLIRPDQIQITPPRDNTP